MMATDPSEAADSSRILPAIRQQFSEPDIWMLGGSIYHLCLNDILANLSPEEDRSLLSSLLVLDDMLAETGDCHYAACIAER